MPSQYNLPAAFANAEMEDVDKYNKLPFYLAMNEVKLYPQWNIYDQLFGSMDWKANMGSIIKGVTPQPSPVGEAFFYPQNLTSNPNKNLYETQESTEEGRIKWHRYESRQFNFLPSFQDFRKNQLDYSHKDIARQIQVSNNLFIRTNLWERAQKVFLCGTSKTAAGFLDAPAAIGDVSAAMKTAAWMAGVLEGVDRGATLRIISNIVNILSEDLQAPAFEGVQNMPSDNDLVKGRYVMTGSSELWDSFRWDPALKDLKSIQLDLTHKGFQGSLFDRLTFKAERFPIRFAKDATGAATGTAGTWYSPVPQVMDIVTKKTRPNPDYVNAPLEAGYVLGADVIKTLKVGPPPSEFAKRAVSADKFYKLDWNGEIRITDDILITTSSGGNITSVETNRYGLQLQLISQAHHACIGGEILNYFPFIYKRTRAAIE